MRGIPGDLTPIDFATATTLVVLIIATALASFPPYQLFPMEDLIMGLPALAAISFIVFFMIGLALDDLDLL